MRVFRFSLLGLLLVGQFGLLPGCATLPADQSRRAVADDAAQTLFAELLRRGEQGRTLRGVAKVRVRTPEQTANGTQVLLAEAPGRLRAETLSPFGVPLLVMTANDTELAVLIPGDNRFYRGRATAENLGRFTRLPLRPTDLVGILLHRPPLLAYRGIEAFELASGGWLVNLETGQRRQELLFDAGRRLIEVRYLTGEELQLRVVYGDFGAEPQGRARRIDLELPLQRIVAGLVFSELEMDKPLSGELFTLHPPEGAEITELDELAASQPPLATESR